MVAVTEHGHDGKTYGTDNGKQKKKAHGQNLGGTFKKAKQGFVTIIGEG